VERVELHGATGNEHATSVCRNTWLRRPIRRRILARAILTAPGAKRQRCRKQIRVRAFGKRLRSVPGSARDRGASPPRRSSEVCGIAPSTTPSARHLVDHREDSDAGNAAVADPRGSMPHGKTAAPRSGEAAVARWRTRRDDAADNLASLFVSYAGMLLAGGFPSPSIPVSRRPHRGKDAARQSAILNNAEVASLLTCRPTNPGKLLRPRVPSLSAMSWTQKS